LSIDADDFKRCIDQVSAALVRCRMVPASMPLAEFSRICVASTMARIWVRKSGGSILGGDPQPVAPRASVDGLGLQQRRARYNSSPNGMRPGERIVQGDRHGRYTGGRRTSIRWKKTPLAVLMRTMVFCA